MALGITRMSSDVFYKDKVSGIRFQGRYRSRLGPRDMEQVSVQCQIQFRGEEMAGSNEVDDMDAIIQSVGHLDGL